MVELRRRLSQWLLETGIELAMDRQEMLRRACQREPPPETDFLDVLGLLEGVSALALRLGILLMPTRPPLAWSAEAPAR
jgi:hypothetical protein